MLPALPPPQSWRPASPPQIYAHARPMAAPGGRRTSASCASIFFVPSARPSALRVAQLCFLLFPFFLAKCFANQFLFWIVTGIVRRKQETNYSLFEEVDNLPGFELEHKSKYYTHLAANPDIATTFISLSLIYKITWVTTFVNERC
jgi:hypothetical protein